MSDQYNKGYTGTGARPTQYGTDQAAYDIGAQRRQSEQFMRQQERQQQMYDSQRRQQEQWRNQQGGQDGATIHRPGTYTAPTPEEAAETREAIAFVVGIGAFIFVLVSGWNALVGQLNPANPILAAIVQHGAWGVGIGGFLIGRQIHQLLGKIVAILVGVFLLIVAIGFGLGVIDGVMSVMNK